MSGGFAVDPDQLDGCAADLEASAARLQGAAGPNLLSTEAYGQVGQVFAVSTVAAAGLVLLAARCAGGRVGGAAAGLRAAAAGYRDTEAAALRGLYGAAGR